MTTQRMHPGTVVLLGALVALGPLTINLYLPAFPAIAEELGAGEGQVQLTMTATLLGIATGHLFLGSLSDALGRRRPLLVAYSLYVLVSLAIAVVPDVGLLMGLRVVQGVLGSAGMVIALAAVRDLTEGFAVGRTISRLMLVVGVAPILAPALGAQLLLLGSWRWLFVVLAALAAVLAVLVALLLPETLPAERRRAGGTRAAARSYRGLLRDPRFRGLVVVAGITMAGQFTYITASTFVFQDTYGLTAQQYGLVFGAGALTVTAGTQLTGFLVGRVPEERIATGALTTALAGALALTAVGLFLGTDRVGLVVLLAVLVPTLGAVGMMFPAIPTMALGAHAREAGSAAALIGAAQFGMAAVGAPTSGLLGGSVVAVGGAMSIFFALALTVMVGVARRRTV